MRNGSSMMHSTPAPHVRGSTPAGLDMPSNGFVCPAYAGINRLRLLGLRDTAKPLPRTRGDRPGGIGLNRLILRPCPARTGIDPDLVIFSNCNVTPPRARGDRPEERRCSRCGNCPAPHARGSTGRVARAFSRIFPCRARGSTVGKRGRRLLHGPRPARGDPPEALRARIMKEPPAAHGDRPS